MSERADGIVIIEAFGNARAGRLTFQSGAADLRARVTAASAAGATKILMDLGQITSIDSSGTGQIVASYAAARRMGAILKLANPTTRVREVLELTRIDTVIETYGDTDTALRSFAD